MAESLDQKLKRLEAEYEKAKSALTRAEGSLEADMKRLKKEHGFEDVETATSALEQLQREIGTLEEKLGEALEDLDEALREDS